MHRFDATRHLDVFDSATKLIFIWEKLFPGQKWRGRLSDKPIVYEMSGDRLQFFSKTWLAKADPKEGQRVGLNGRGSGLYSFVSLLIHRDHLPKPYRGEGQVLVIEIHRSNVANNTCKVLR